MLDLRQVRTNRRAPLLYSARNQKEEEKPRFRGRRNPRRRVRRVGLFRHGMSTGRARTRGRAGRRTIKELLFFDIESRQENGNHEPNLCIVQNEAGEEWIFQGDKTRDEFCEWLFTDEHANCTVMAHNFQGYDSYFILQYLREQGVKYDVIMRGAKVLSLVVEMFNIRFIDSLNFIPMKLANLPKTFGIEELKKGYFPHLFNKKENENYVGRIPPAPHYNPNGINPKDKEAFMIWHASKRESNYVFNLHEEIIAYCRSDVDILRRCSLEFRELFYNVTDIDPFTMLTIASACHLVYRTNYLPKDTIGIIPPMGYTPKKKQPLFAHKWLSYTAEKREVNFESMCELVFLRTECGVTGTVTVDIPFRITRNTRTKEIQTKRMKKDYRVVYNKRVIIDDYKTFPYGY